MNSSNFQALLEPRLRKVFFDAYDEKPEEYSQVFHVASSKKARETDQHVTGLGLWEKKSESGPISYAEIGMGDEVSYVHEEYAKGIQVPRKLVDDEMYHVIDKLPKELGRGGRALVEITAAKVLSDGFTKIGYDGQPLFSDSHPLKGKDKQNPSSVGDNLLDLRFDEKGEALEEAILLLQGQVNDNELKIQAKADTLIIPTDLEFKALRVLNSTLRAGTGDNDTNVLKGKLKPVILSYLTSPTAFFVADSSLHQLWFFWRVKPEFKGEENFDTMVAKYRGYLRFSVGYSDWRGIVGSEGTADPDPEDGDE